ncbi:YbjN domain-containing protein [Arcanobacterium pinnipediorum]|uniref:YbjN domain-containing protein n=1 Tax=Arcanobacterium pinnipediorum TaxID=1503041 RepID=A0ABY5AHK4_9ACTO|nr:YbjN domain-containing protein [Arcanobacterium pinnipediorum]USR79335.1 YbjN domain-containing protein [Arcanobacterium pinnipediorum]
MAWFKKNKDTLTPSPVTIERVKQVFDNNEWTFDVDEERDNTLLTGFDGRFTVVRLIEESNILTIATYGTGAILPAERFGEALAWANNWNKETVFGTAHPHVDDDNDLIMNVDVSFPLEAGATDEQLERYVGLSVSLNVQAIDKYIEDLQIPQPEQNENE